MNMDAILPYIILLVFFSGIISLLFFLRQKGRLLDTKHIGFILTIILFSFLLAGEVTYAQEQNKELTDRKATLFLSPHRGTVLAGSTFDVSVFLDTRGNSVNTVELDLKFPPNKLTIVKPSGGRSFISLWTEPPTYSNTRGTAQFTGGIPNGITTESGLVTTITFKARATGQAIVEVLPSSKVLANDGRGTNILTGFGRGVYTVNPRPPEGLRVFSETHPFEDKWYNNNNPVITWEKDAGITDFSFELNNKPLSIPDNTPDTKDTIKAYEDLGNGLWYFHIKARRAGVWGGTTHFLSHIDTTPPRPFRPKVEILTAAVANKALVSFFTTDALSGVDHYEVGVIDRKKSPLESPVFVEAQSPYQLSNFISGDLRVIVRAIDKAGNTRDESLDILVPPSFISFIGDNTAVIFLLILIALIAIHYLYGHRIIARMKRIYKILKREEARGREKSTDNR